MIKLTGKKALVTRSNGGTSLATARLLSAQSAQVAITGRDQMMPDEEIWRRASFGSS